MDLDSTDVAKLLNITSGTLMEWVDADKIPYYRINGHLRFNREEIENWMLSNSIDETYQPDNTPRGRDQYSLFRALHKGSIITDVKGNDKAAIICNAMQHMAQSLELDTQVISEMLLDRERLMSTALGDGIAVPHTRDFLLEKAYDVVTVVFPENPIEYDALDGKPVYALFFLFACKDTSHLNLLAKIAHFCNQKYMQEFLKGKPSKDALLQQVKEWEASLSLLQPVG